MSTVTRRRSHWGWGFEDRLPSAEQLEGAARMARETLGFGGEEIEQPVPFESIELSEPRLEPPDALAGFCSADDHDRAVHAQGKAYRDVIRAFRGRIDNPPDFVAHPTDEGEVEAVLEWCCDAGAAAIPYGGGTSVVGGVEPRLGGGYAGAVSLDLGALDRLLDVDESSRAARIQAGAPGPRLEDQLGEHGLTLRHYPGSFEFSTLGGWIATRAGGHFATVETHIDDLVESVRALTPLGAWESRRLPGSGAGPSPDRMLIGSEGTLGIITEAWVRVRERPRWKQSTSVAFESFAAGAGAVRALSQSGLRPENCRLLDETEASLNVGSDERAVLVLGFESADHPVGPWMERALEIVRDHGGAPSEVRSREEASNDGAVSEWRQRFLAQPYVRDTLIQIGVLAETFETAITWDRFEEFDATVRAAATSALDEVCGGGRLMCRFTHVYPDGPAPYFTVLAPAKRGGELEQWDEVKAAVSDALIDAGGTITHHHAVGRDHRPWYDRQRPEPFARALRAAKAELDPGAILNPGVIIDP